MRIAVFAKRTTFHHGYGGLETQNKLLCEGLAKRGYDVTVFSPDWGLTLDEADENGVRYVFVKCIYRMGPVFGFFGTKQKSNWINRSVEEFEKIHLREKFDLALAQSSTGLGIIFKKRQLNIKVVSVSHGTIIGEYRTFISSMRLPKDFLALIKNTAFTLKNFFRRQREFVHGSDKVIAVSNFVKKSLIDETYVEDDKIEVINNGIDPSPFSAITQSYERGTKLLYVGQIIKSKGLEDIYKIFMDPLFSGLEIDLVGGGDYFDELNAKVKSAGLENRFHLLGKTSSYNEVVEKYYKNPDYGIFVMPSKRYEGFPMVLAEAMFAGLPVVAYNIGGISDAVLDSTTGYLIKPDNLPEFKQKLLYLIESGSTRQTFSRNAIDCAHARFTLDIMLDHYEKVFKEVLK